LRQRVAALEGSKGAAGRTLLNLRPPCRSQEHRRGADVASASRPHQRHPRPRWLDGIPERRDHGAGEGLGILDNDENAAKAQSNEMSGTILPT